MRHIEGCWPLYVLHAQARAWVKAHLREALRLQKPLLLAGVGALRPQPWRRQLLAMVQREVALAVRAGQPIAGERTAPTVTQQTAFGAMWALRAL